MTEIESKLYPDSRTESDYTVEDVEILSRIYDTKKVGFYRKLKLYNFINHTKISFDKYHIRFLPCRDKIDRIFMLGTSYKNIEEITFRWLNERKKIYYCFLDVVYGQLTRYHAYYSTDNGLSINNGIKTIISIDPDEIIKAGPDMVVKFDYRNVRYDIKGFDKYFMRLEIDFTIKHILKDYI